MAALSAFPPAPAPAPAQGEVLDLPLSSILVGERLRPVDLAVAELMAVSIEESGQLTPVLVRPSGVPGSYELVTGGHRHAATRVLGRSTIRAEVRELSDAEAQLIEVDENLIRRNLTPHERALSVQARYGAWAARFPERIIPEETGGKAKRGRPAKSRTLRQFTSGVQANMGFAEETAADLGFHRATVFRAMEVCRGLSRASHAKIAGTWVSKSEGVLRQLAGITDGAEQARVLDVLLAGRTKSVSDARALAAGRTPTRHSETPPDEAVKAWRKVWTQASPSTRRLLLEEMSGWKLIDTWSLER